MSRKKQIEEMAKVLCCDYGDCKRCHLSNPECENPCMVYEDVSMLYNAGYRKQGEGDWGISKIGDGGTTRTCSNCHISQTVNVYKGKVMFKYCPYCGAKMKGE